MINKPKRMARVGATLKSRNTRRSTLNIVDSFGILKKIDQGEGLITPRSPPAFGQIIDWAQISSSNLQ